MCPTLLTGAASVGYLLGGRIATRSVAEQDSRPAAEYELFARRNPVLLTDYNALDARPSLGRLAFRWNLAPVALAAHATTRKFERMLVSGEDIGMPLLMLQRLRGDRAPTFIITHGSYFRSPRFAFLMRLFRGMKHVHFLCLSASLQRALIEKFGVAETNAHNCSYGVDTDFFTPASPISMPVSSNPVIASAGAANRDYTTLVHAVRGLHADVRIAADSAWFPTAVQLPEVDIPSNVEVRSYGNYANLRQLYARASFVVVPLLPAEHACGYAVIAEAMAMGKAVIATRTSRPSDFVREGETGFLVDPCAPGELRERVAYLLEHPEEAVRMGSNARDLVAKNYSLEAYCSRLERVVFERMI